jgi:3-hydroxy-9,10-secoandrosta-1,3,5(10)-triene-9,17-dione monooxygenase
MTKTTTKEDLIDRARAIAPLFAEQARASEKLRRPSDDAIAAIEEAEIFKMMVPRCYGGLELDMDTFIEVVLTLSEGDASLAWVTAFLIEHNWMFCLFPESFQKSLFSDRSYVLAPGMVAPSGVAKPVSGGVELSGRWQFATGVWHSSWIIAGAIQLNDNDVPDPRFFAIPREEVTVEDTWHVDGMCGTGSHDVVIEECFVPDDRSVSMLEMNRGSTPGAVIHAGPL